MNDLSNRTGRTRHRVSKGVFGGFVLILQVEIRVQGTHFDEHGYGPSFDNLRWRDASVEDLTENKPL